MAQSCPKLHLKCCKRQPGRSKQLSQALGGSVRKCEASYESNPTTGRAREAQHVSPRKATSRQVHSDAVRCVDSSAALVRLRLDTALVRAARRRSLTSSTMTQLKGTPPCPRKADSSSNPPLVLRVQQMMWDSRMMMLWVFCGRP